MNSVLHHHGATDQLGDTVDDTSGSVLDGETGLPATTPDLASSLVGQDLVSSNAMMASAAPLSAGILVVGNAPVTGGAPVLSVSPAHLVINVTYDSSVTGLSTALQASYKSAVQAAVQFYESTITSPVTLNINFGYGEAGGSPISAGALGQSSTFFSQYTYTQLYDAVKATDTTSAAQMAAFNVLSSIDPTAGNGHFIVSTAEAKALGLRSASSATDGSVGLDSQSSFSWSQASVASGSYDAVGTLEHEISEVMGRTADLGKSSEYTLLDMYHYTAADGLASDAPGSAAGALDEPFVAGYNAAAFSYFSYNGTTVTNPYETPANIANGNDVADWADTVANDSFGYGVAGQAAPVTATDLTEMNVLGYDMACYAIGTRVRIPDGEVAIERLRPGDALVLARGGTAVVRWIGHRRVDLARHPDRARAQPVRIAAGTFGAGLPARDLLLSPEHAIYWDGALVPARHLVGCPGIAVDASLDTVEYFHVELDHHDVLLAEGLPCESWLDTGNRSMFANAGVTALTFAEAPTSAEAWARHACAPLVEGGTRLDAIRRALGGAWTQDVALDTVGVHRVAVAPGAGAVRLLSRQRFAEGDARPLGAAIRAIHLDGIEIALDDACLGRGFHACEAAWRWTDGAALLALGAAEVERSLQVEVSMVVARDTRAA